jgi:hypothetical protein
MFVTDGTSNYDKVCEELLELVWATGAVANAPMLSGSVEQGAARIPLFGEDCSVRRDGVYKGAVKLDTIGSILVVRYLLAAGTAQMQHTWLPYRDLKDGAQFSGFIKTNIEDKIASAFQGKRVALQERLSALGAVRCAEEVQGDIALVLHPLPKVPVLSLFWDRDEEFPASFQFLFDGSASSYLDLEALAAMLQYIYLKLAGAA